MTETLSVLEVAQRAQRVRPAFRVTWRPALMQYAELFSAAAATTESVDACMLAAIVARETGGQNILQIGVSPGPGCGVGLCQITSGVDWSVISAPAFPGYGPLLDPHTNLLVASCEFLVPLFRQFPNNHLAVFAAYNVGPSAVSNELQHGLSPDAWTTNHDYGTDVFTSWINFSAVALGVNVDWANHQAPQPTPPPNRPPSQPPAPPSTAPTTKPSDPSDDLSE